MNEATASHVFTCLIRDTDGRRPLLPGLYEAAKRMAPIAPRYGNANTFSGTSPET